MLACCAKLAERDEPGIRSGPAWWFSSDWCQTGPVIKTMKSVHQGHTPTHRAGLGELVSVGSYVDTTRDPDPPHQDPSP